MLLAILIIVSAGFVILVAFVGWTLGRKEKAAFGPRAQNWRGEPTHVTDLAAHEFTWAMNQEAEEAGVALTPGAREFLLIPFVEAQQYSQTTDVDELMSTLRRIMKAIREDPDSRDRHRKHRTSLSVVRAYHREFCRIPPFCARGDSPVGNDV